MIRWGPIAQIALGVALMLIAILLPFLMILNIIASTFSVNFLAFALSFGGMIVGLLGVSQYVRPGGRHGD